MEIENFIHGAMCISYSGRCLLSNYFTGRDANQGACTDICRNMYSGAMFMRKADSFSHLFFRKIFRFRPEAEIILITGLSSFGTVRGRSG